MAILTSKGARAPHQLKGRRNVRISRDRRGCGNDDIEQLKVEVNKALADKAEYQNQNSNYEYVNSNDNKYLVIQRQNVSKIYYFNSEAYILIDDAGNKICFLTFVRNDNGVNAILTAIAGDSLLSIYKVSEEYCVLTTNANWPKKYTVYSLNGYNPKVYATSVSPL